MKPLRREDVEKALNVVRDPELRLGVVDLGLVYEISLSSTNDVSIVMTVTTPGCPVIDQFLEQAEAAARGLPEVGQVTVKLTFTPLWTPDRIKPQARKALGL